jgi:hypothetical protein
MTLSDLIPPTKLDLLTPATCEALSKLVQHQAEASDL